MRSVERRFALTFSESEDGSSTSPEVLMWCRLRCDWVVGPLLTFMSRGRSSNRK